MSLYYFDVAEGHSKASMMAWNLDESPTLVIGRFNMQANS